MSALLEPQTMPEINAGMLADLLLDQALALNKLLNRVSEQRAAADKLLGALPAANTAAQRLQNSFDLAEMSNFASVADFLEKRKGGGAATERTESTEDVAASWRLANEASFPCCGPLVLAFRRAADGAPIYFLASCYFGVWKDEEGWALEEHQWPTHWKPLSAPSVSSVAQPEDGP